MPEANKPATGLGPQADDQPASHPVATSPHVPPITPPAASPAAGGFASAGSSLLDNTETNSQQATSAQCPPSYSHSPIPVPCDANAEFRHSCWHRQRQATYDAFRRLSISPSRLEAFERCGSAAFVYKATVGPEDYCVRGSHCRDRFCVPCALGRTYAVTAKLQELAQDKNLRFITLTLRARADEALRDQLDRLFSAFRQLRRLELWHENVDGGCAVCEVKRTERGRWHSHLHILVEGKFIDQARLSKAWHAITADSFIVDVRRVTDRGDAVRYVAKYAAKPMEAGFWRIPSLLEEAIMALRGRRLVITFGTWHNREPDLDDADADWTFNTDPRRWECVCDLTTLWTLAMGGDPAAKHVLDFLRVRDPLTGERPPRPPPS